MASNIAEQGDRHDAPDDDTQESSSLLDAMRRLVESLGADSANGQPTSSQSGSFIEVLRNLDRSNHSHPSYPAFSAGADQDHADEGSSESSVERPARDMLDRFELIKVMGDGGFAVVLGARDRLTNRQVAIKIPRPEFLCDSSLVARFSREPRILAALDHPNIVPVLETGWLQHVPYFVMAFGDLNLNEWLQQRRGPVPCPLAARIVLELAGGADHAHRRGLLHRDIKPSNILLFSTENPDHKDYPYVPKLGDFGLARETALDHSLTGDQTLIGTIAYMSPEQAAGRTRDISIQSDVYSLGVVLFEMLAGRTPFVAESPAAVLRLIGEEPAPRLQRLRPDVPADLAAICQRCLEKSPRDRYASAAELRDDLQRFLAREPVTARALGPITRLARWSRRKPLIASMAAGIVLLGLGGLSGIFLQWQRAEANAEVARQNATLAAAEAQRAEEHLAHAQRTLFDLAWIAEESSLWTDKSDPFRLMLIELTNKYYRILLQQAPESQLTSDVRAAASTVEAMDSARQGNEDAAETKFRQSFGFWHDAIRKHPDLPHLRRALAISLFNHAVFQMRKGVATESWDWNNVPTGPLEDIITQEAHDPLILAEYAGLLFALGNNLARGGQADQARLMYRTSLMAYMRLHHDHPESEEYAFRQAQVERHLGSALRRQDPTQAAQLFESSLAGLEKLAATYPNDATICLQFAETCRVLGVHRFSKKDPKALDAFIRGQAVLDPLLAAQPHNLEIASALAVLLREIAEYHAAWSTPQQHAEALAKRRELWETLDGKVDFTNDMRQQFAMGCYREARLAEQSDRIDFANDRFVQARYVFERLLEDRPSTGRPRNAFAHCLMICGDRARREGKMDQAEADYRAALGQLDKLDKKHQTNETEQHRSAIIKRLSMFTASE